MSTISLLLLLALAGVGGFALRQHRRTRQLEREQEVRAFVFPDGALAGLRKAYPQFGPKETQLVCRALRQFFIVHIRAGGRLVAMPSKAADALWHALILDTRTYAGFCKLAFGRYLHHVPESAMPSADKDGNATWRTWRLACLEENLNPRSATRLPLLFALDAKLALEGAQRYDPAQFKPPATAGSCGATGCGGGGDCSGCGGGCGGGE